MSTDGVIKSVNVLHDELSLLIGGATIQTLITCRPSCDYTYAAFSLLVVFTDRCYSSKRALNDNITYTYSPFSTRPWIIKAALSPLQLRFYGRCIFVFLFIDNLNTEVPVLSDGYSVGRTCLFKLVACSILEFLQPDHVHF